MSLPKLLPLTTVKLAPGSYVASIGAVNYKKHRKTLFVEMWVEGARVSPTPAINLDRVSAHSSEHAERFQSFLDATDLTASQLDRLHDEDALERLTGQLTRLHVRVVQGKPSNGTPEITLYSWGIY